MPLDDAILQALATLNTEVVVETLALDGREPRLAGELERLARRMAAASRRVRVERAAWAAPVRDIPGLAVRGEGTGRVIWSILPRGLEAKPFLEYLGMLAVSGEPASRRPEVAAPASVVLFVTPECPTCPRAVSAAAAVAAREPRVTVQVVDVSTFPSLLPGVVRSVPFTLIDDRLSLDAVQTERSLLGHLARRGSPAWDRAVFRSMVDSGRHGAAAERLCEGANRYFLDSWSASTLGERIRLMLVAEEAIERRERCLDAIVPALVKILATDDPSLRGDTADLLGRIGHPDVLGPLTSLLADENAHVAEVAREVLGELGPRMSAARRAIARAEDEC